MGFLLKPPVHSQLNQGGDPKMNYYEPYLHGDEAVRPQSNCSTSFPGASNVVDPMTTVRNSNIPQLKNAMQILWVLSDVGKALPSVAPALIVLDIIIALERRAANVDAKCTDLIERITFMVSHLPALLNMDIMASTRQVISRMNEGIMDAAALIATYRKQGHVARRLNFRNREKFTACAETINNCSKDLLKCILIHQTVQLNILTRAIPTDGEDVAAQSFVATHGGNIVAIVNDREWVEEFAQQEHLDMDDSVMEQLNINIDDSMQENRVRLEGILEDTASGATNDRSKNLAIEMLLMPTGQKFHCVQCDKEFMDRTNGPNACLFHRAEYNAWWKSYPCCALSHPCEVGSHRAGHHCDYPYSAFFPRYRGVLNGIDTLEEWASVEDTNLETDDTQKASVSELYKWSSRAASVDEKTLLITVGVVSYKSPYYFNTFTLNQLEEVTNSVCFSHHVLIFRTSASEDEFAQADWVLSASGKVTGVRLTAKTATSPKATVRVCPIDLPTCTKSGDVITVSEGGMRSYTPSEPYVLPQDIRIGPELSSEQTRPVRTDFTTRTTPGLKVILKTMSDPPLAANQGYGSKSGDYLQGTVSVFNNNPPNSSNMITISGIRAEYRLVGEQAYAPVKECKFTDGSDLLLPYSVDAHKSWQINFQVLVPRTEEDTKLKVKWWTRAFMARHRPVRIKLILEDTKGEECSLVLEYVFKPHPYETASERDLKFFFFDDPITFKRCIIRVESVSSDSVVVRFGGNDITVKWLKKAVYQALKSGKTEIDLGIGGEHNGGECEWAAYALVDISCRKVYAFKIIMLEGKGVPVKRFGCQGYILCPDYVDLLNCVQPVSHAMEVAKLPPMEPYNQLEYAQDDTVDDFDSHPTTQLGYLQDDSVDNVTVPVPPTTLPSPTMERPSLSNNVNSSYVKEVTKPPPIKPLSHPGYRRDDNADLAPAPPTTQPTPPTQRPSFSNSVNGPVGVSAELSAMLTSYDKRFASIDANLTRIADALDKIIAMALTH